MNFQYVINQHRCTFIHISLCIIAGEISLGYWNRKEPELDLGFFPASWVYQWYNSWVSLPFWPRFLDTEYFVATPKHLFIIYLRHNQCEFWLTGFLYKLSYLMMRHSNPGLKSKILFLKVTSATPLWHHGFHSAKWRALLTHCCPCVPHSRGKSSFFPSQTLDLK